MGGKIKLVISLIVVAVFIYLIATNISFRKYTENKITNINTTLPGSNQILNFYNDTKNMTKGAFINWSINSSNNNSVIDGIKNSSKNTTALQDNLARIWNKINSLKNISVTSVNYTSEIYENLKGTLASIKNSSS